MIPTADQCHYCELIRIGLQDCNTSFMNQGTARVPWLDNLSEDDLDLGFVFLLDKWNH